MRTSTRLRKLRTRKMTLNLEDDCGTFTLANTIRSARMIVVAPLATAAYNVPMMISVGNYTAALKCALFSSAAFLILAISTSVADLLTRLIETRLDIRSVNQPGKDDPRTLSSRNALKVNHH